MTALSLVSLNVERLKHLDSVLPFLEKRRADVVCIQEIVESAIPDFSSALGAIEHRFVPMQRRVDEPEKPIWGIGIFSRLPIAQSTVSYYAGSAARVPNSDRDALEKAGETNRAVLSADIQKDETSFRIANTHFKWTPDGTPDDVQRRDMSVLLEILSELGEFVLAGDFNAPRGGEIFGALSSRYKDNIPPQYKTSLDIALHRAGKDRPHELADKMVDGLFSTPAYRVTNVELVSGVSDHMAVVANISTAGKLTSAYNRIG